MSNDLSAFFGGTPFTPATIEPQTDIDVYPPGKYPVLIEKAEVRETKAKTGHFIGLTLQILDGPHRSRKLFDNINIDNPSEQCVEIGMRTLSALGRALGLQAITNTDQLLGGVVIAHVKVKDNQNNVRTYSASGVMAAIPPIPSAVTPAAAHLPPLPGAAPPVTPAPAATTPPAQKPTADQRPPWEG